MDCQTIKYNGPAIHSTNVTIKKMAIGYLIIIRAMTIIDAALVGDFAISQVTKKRYGAKSLMSQVRYVETDELGDSDDRDDYYSLTLKVDENGDIVHTYQHKSATVIVALISFLKWGEMGDGPFFKKFEKKDRPPFQKKEYPHV